MDFFSLANEVLKDSSITYAFLRCVVPLGDHTLTTELQLN